MLVKHAIRTHVAEWKGCADAWGLALPFMGLTIHGVQVQN